LVEPAAVVDHITPHGGDEALFWDRDNWQPLCKPCHDAKTAREDGGFGRVAVNWHPEFLRPSAVPLTIVCGPPLAGKTTYVDRNRAPGDVVIDLDMIGAEVCGCGPYDWPVSRLNDVGRERNRRLMALARPMMERARAWFIVGDPDPRNRAWWATTLQPEAIVVVETPRIDCVRRAESVDRGGRNVVPAIDQWWRSYRRRPGDLILRPADPAPWPWGVGAGQISAPTPT
jgi:5-methylcytosine-specific restriction protein A